jgi:hypothetical protein
MPRSVARHSAPITSAARTCSTPWDGSPATCQRYPSGARRLTPVQRTLGLEARSAAPTEPDRAGRSLPLRRTSRCLSDPVQTLVMDETQKHHARGLAPRSARHVPQRPARRARGIRLALCAKGNSRFPSCTGGRGPRLDVDSPHQRCRSWERRAPAKRTAPNGRTISSMCWTLLTLGLSTGTVVLWRGGSTHNQRLEISGVVLLVAAVIVGAYFS